MLRLADKKYRKAIEWKEMFGESPFKDSLVNPFVLDNSGGASLLQHFMGLFVLLM